MGLSFSCSLCSFFSLSFLLALSSGDTLSGLLIVPHARNKQGDDQIAFEGDMTYSGTDLKWPERAKKVKDAFVHAYAGYKTYPFGIDELKSLSNGGVNNLNGWGPIIIDSPETMLLMGLKPQFIHATL